MPTMTSLVQCAQVTASFQPLHTQNTAPIIEHRCLYTQDLRRKAKRWQDGVLRFHTFNRRVMVYDVPRNFVGDTHWREDYPIQDGDELELDRPVLVQVGEQVGSVDQDLTELFEKRHRKNTIHDETAGPHSSSPPTPLRSSGLNLNGTMATRVVPKSLNALLGTPKGRIGRAALPTKSPYELRLVNNAAARAVEPQAKRQRIERAAHQIQPAIISRVPSAVVSDTAGTEDTHLTDRVHDFTKRTVSRNLERPRVIRPSIVNASSSQPNTTRTISLDTEAETQQIDITTQFYNGSRIEKNTSPAQVDGDHQPQGSTARKTERRIKCVTNKSAVSKLTSNQKVPEPSNIILVPSDTETSSTHSDKRVSSKTRLQLVSRKPRRKLMYKDLLPPDAMAVKTTHRRSRGNGSDIEHQVKSPNDIRPKQTARTERPRDNYKRVRRKTEEIVSPSAGDADRVFDPANARNNGPPSRFVTEEVDGSGSPSPEVAEPSIPRAAPTIHDTNAVLAQMDEILLSRSQVPGPITTKQRSPLQKSNSDMPRTTITRSISHVDKSTPIAGAPSEAKEQVISPWSSEAWDLFGCGRDGQAVDFATFCMNEDV